MASSSHWRPTASSAAMRARGRLLGAIRRFFGSKDFLEVETPLLSREIVVDRHLDPFFVTLYGDPTAPEAGPTYFLQTSPEFAMKRLLATGEFAAIYQICKAFRAGERGELHNPEFTMLEWYRVGDDYEQGMELLAELIAAILAAFGGEAEKPVAVERRSYRELFLRSTGLDPHGAAVEDLIAWARSKSPPPPELSASDRDSWLDWIGSQFAEKTLDPEIPTIVFDFPASKAALAQVSTVDGAAVAQRFELYYRGLELANGYHELLDAEVLARRAKLANLERQQDGKRPLPIESRLLEAMRSGLPPCAGTALGVDRLLMALLKTSKIEEVLAFPADRA